MRKATILGSTSHFPSPGNGAQTRRGLNELSHDSITAGLTAQNYGFLASRRATRLGGNGNETIGYSHIEPVVIQLGFMIKFLAIIFVFV